MRSPETRFKRLTKKMPSGCEVFQGKNGRFWDGETWVRATHYAWELVREKLPKGTRLYHVAACPERSCTWVPHLERRTEEDRFWSSVVEDEDGCLLFMDKIRDGGYALFYRGDGTYELAHRYLYRTHVGEITEETLDHRCRKRNCIHPDCLVPKSIRDNVMAEGSRALGKLNADKTHCAPCGKPLSGENLYRRADGRRVCRACMRRWAAKSRTTRKAPQELVATPVRRRS